MTFVNCFSFVRYFAAKHSKNRETQKIQLYINSETAYIVCSRFIYENCIQLHVTTIQMLSQCCANALVKVNSMAMTVPSNQLILIQFSRIFAITIFFSHHNNDVDAMMPVLPIYGENVAAISPSNPPRTKRFIFVDT